MGKDIFIEFLKSLCLKDYLLFIITLLLISLTILLYLDLLITALVVFYISGSFATLYGFSKEGDLERIDDASDVFMIFIFCLFSWFGFFGVLFA